VTQITVGFPLAMNSLFIRSCHKSSACFNQL